MICDSCLYIRIANFEPSNRKAHVSSDSMNSSWPRPKKNKIVRVLHEI